MADGTRLTRLIDASVYPKHVLYAGETVGTASKQETSQFEEGTDWVANEDGIEGAADNTAFNKWTVDATITGAHPWGPGAASIYEARGWRLGDGNHPVAIEGEDGEYLTKEDLQREFVSDWLVPSLADAVILDDDLIEELTTED